MKTIENILLWSFIVEAITTCIAYSFDVISASELLTLIWIGLGLIALSIGVALFNAKEE